MVYFERTISGYIFMQNLRILLFLFSASWTETNSGATSSPNLLALRYFSNGRPSLSALHQVHPGHESQLHEKVKDLSYNNN